MLLTSKLDDVILNNPNGFITQKGNVNVRNSVEYSNRILSPMAHISKCNLKKSRIKITR